MKDEELRKKIKKETPEFPEGIPLVIWLLNYRRISYWIIKRLVRTRITPNQVTFFEIMLFLISILLICTGYHFFMIIGAFLNIICVYLDYVDGDLARAKSMTSEFGKKLDAANDHLAAVLLPISMTSALFIQTGNSYILIIGAIIIVNVFFISHHQKNLLLEMEESKKDIQENMFNKLNRIQQKILQVTGVKIGLCTLREVDTRFLIFWLGCLFNQLLFTLIYYLVWSIYEMVNMYFHYRKLIKD